MCAIGILKDFNRFRKYNLQSIAEGKIGEAHEKRTENEEKETENELQSPETKLQIQNEKSEHLEADEGMRLDKEMDNPQEAKKLDHEDTIK